MIASLPLQSHDRRLWLAALAASLCLNVAIVLVLALAVLQSWWLRVAEPVEPSAGDDAARVVIVPVPPAAAPPERESAPQFARTSPDQVSGRPEEAPFVGERDTLAASELEPTPGAEPLPAQDGVERRFGEVETTESDYQDGDLTHQELGAPGSSGAPATPEASEATASAAAGEPMEIPRPSEDDEAGTEEQGPKTRDPVRPETRLAEGPLSVDRPARPEEMVEEDPKPAPGSEARRPGERGEADREVAEQPKQAASSSGRPPGFRGFQRRTALKGSISRRGRASLDVQEGALGRYYAELSRAIERSWQRKCVQHRDFITPGVIRVRVVLDGEGRVRSVGTVEEFGIGTIQKGFTHSAIREAPLPKMPAEVRGELDGEALELLYNFIF